MNERTPPSLTVRKYNSHFIDLLIVLLAQQYFLVAMKTIMK